MTQELTKDEFLTASTHLHAYLNHLVSEDSTLKPALTKFLHLAQNAPDLLDALTSMYFAVSDYKTDYKDKILFDIIQRAKRKARMTMLRAGTLKN